VIDWYVFDFMLINGMLLKFTIDGCGIGFIHTHKKKKLFSCLDVVFVNLVGIGGYEGIMCNVHY
jgi:hypothetical protein